MSSPNALSNELPLDTQFLLALLDLKTERLLQEVEPLVMAIANKEAAEAALQDFRDRSSI